MDLKVTTGRVRIELVVVQFYRRLFYSSGQWEKCFLGQRIFIRYILSALWAKLGNSCSTGVERRSFNTTNLIRTRNNFIIHLCSPHLSPSYLLLCINYNFKTSF